MRSINAMMMGAITAIVTLVLVSLSATMWSNAQLAEAREQSAGATRVLRTHMTADMMHDAMRGDVLSILRAAQSRDGSLGEAQTSLGEDGTKLRQMIAADRAYRGSSAVAAGAARIQPKVDAYLAGAQRIAESAATDPAQASAMLPGFLQSFEDLEGAMSTLSDTIEAHLVEVDKHADAVARFASLLLAITTAALLALVAAVAVLARRHVVRPLLALAAVVTRMSNGELSVIVPALGRRDELGDVATATDRLRNQLIEAEQAKEAQARLIVDSFGHALARLAEGDLVSRVDAELTGPFGKIKEDFNAAVSTLQVTLSGMSQAVSGISDGASDIRQASDDLSQRTEQQAASLEETAAAMDEITSTVRATASRTVSANTAVRNARDQAQHSGAVVRKAVEAMGGIERTSTEISEIISVIDGIAFQTNLLALNAGVEAARAGDAGRGFAVVASEVRALAQRSAEAAKDVKAKITASTAQVDAGVQLVGETGQALQHIIDRIAEIDTLVAEIAASAEQQSTGLQQVNTAVGEMDGVTQQNAAMVEQATAAARSLASEAEGMAQQIAHFRLVERGQAYPVPAVPARQGWAASVGRQIAAGARRRSPATVGNTALAVVDDDWSEF